MDRYVLDRLVEDCGLSFVIHGGASGADREAELWARSRGISFISFIADWSTYGKAAGPIRNKEMAKFLSERTEDKCVILFPGGRGTQNMRETAEKFEIPVIEMGIG
jgi:hypothetical protein